MLHRKKLLVFNINSQTCLIITLTSINQISCIKTQMQIENIIIFNPTKKKDNHDHLFRQYTNITIFISQNLNFCTLHEIRMYKEIVH